MAIVVSGWCDELWSLVFHLPQIKNMVTHLAVVYGAMGKSHALLGKPFKRRVQKAVYVRLIEICCGKILDI